ncbi:DUF2207 family protein [Candidatus Margulisiibacteriota bacterium]
MKKLIAYIFILFVSMLQFSLAQEEKILSFDSESSLGFDRSIVVTETIKADIKQDQTISGIHRDFITNTVDQYGFNHVRKFEVISVTRDGELIDFWIENIPKGKRAFLGSKDILIAPDEYVYKLTYRTTGQINYRESFDEIILEVSGSDWEYPVGHVDTEISVPVGITEKLLLAKAFKAPSGDEVKNFEASKDAGKFYFSFSDPLPPKCSYAVLLRWPKGIIKESGQGAIYQRLLKDNLGTFIGLLGIILLLAYYVIILFTVRLRIKQHKISPGFEPPAKIYPAMARFFITKLLDSKSVAAIIINMAVKDCIKINQTEKEGSIDFVLEKKAVSKSFLLPEEKLLTLALFNVGQSVSLNTISQSRKQDLRDKIRDSIKASRRNALMIYSLKYIMPAILFSVAVYLLSTLIGLGIIFYSFWNPLILMCLISINFFFASIIKSGGIAGNIIISKINGFNIYLAGAEDKSIANLNPPSKNNALYKEYLPYAIALDAEGEWNHYFADHPDKFDINLDLFLEYINQQTTGT